MPPHEAEAFAAELAADPALAAKAEAWRANDHHMAVALNAAARPIDDALLQRLGLGMAATPVVAAPVEAANDNPRRPMLRWFAAGSALAASLAAAVVLNMSAPGPADPLSDALERTASLAPSKLADGRTITPMLTLRAADGRWCREFREDAQTGLACRKDGRWSLEAHVQGGEAADPGEIAVASGAVGAALDEAYGKLKPSDPLSAPEEARLLANHWE